jgi:Flp pilus assembly protein CpaB
MLLACVIGWLAKQCWLEQAATAGVTAHEQLNKAHGTVLVTKLGLKTFEVL